MNNGCYNNILPYLLDNIYLPRELKFIKNIKFTLKMPQSQLDYINYSLDSPSFIKKRPCNCSQSPANAHFRLQAASRVRNTNSEVLKCQSSNTLQRQADLQQFKVIIYLIMWNFKSLNPNTKQLLKNAVSALFFNQVSFLVFTSLITIKFKFTGLMARVIAKLDILHFNTTL